MANGCFIRRQKKCREAKGNSELEVEKAPFFRGRQIVGPGVALALLQPLLRIETKPLLGTIPMTQSLHLQFHCMGLLIGMP